MLTFLLHTLLISFTTHNSIGKCIIIIIINTIATINEEVHATISHAAIKDGTRNDSQASQPQC